MVATVAKGALQPRRLVGCDGCDAQLRNRDMIGCDVCDGCDAELRNRDYLAGCDGCNAAVAI
jgi:hypothetical protein